MLRALVAALLLANLAFFAWSQGWLDSIAGTRSIGDREPERLARQVRPELVRILPASAAGEPVVAAPAAANPLTCLEAGPFTDAELTAVQTAALAALPGAGIRTVKTERAGVWMVYMGRYAGREALTKKGDELKRRRLDFEELREPPALAPGISLGRFDNRDAATKALEQFAQQGIHTARVVEFAPASVSQTLRFDTADSALAAQALTLKAGALGSKPFAPCPKPAGT